MENIAKHTVFPIAFAAHSKNDETRFFSTSGGIFPELAKSVLAKNGVVVGAKYTSELLVEHIMVRDIKELKSLQQSKYLSSSLKDIFKKIQIELSLNKIVLFCGSPCQVAGLLMFLKKTYTNLITIDFICRGMNSPKAFLSWIKEIEQKEHSTVEKVWFKYKQGGWNSSPTRTKVFFSNNVSKEFFGPDNKYMFGYLNSNLYIRPSCGKCSFKGTNHKSDITLGDFWGLNQMFDDDKGTSLVIINTESGLLLFKTINSAIVCNKVPFEESISQNPMYKESVKLSKYRGKFLRKLNNGNFSKLLDLYMKKQNGKIKLLIKKLVRRKKQ